MLPEGPRRIRFGVFELDQQELELRKDGTLLKLAPQPFRVLALLADCEGQVVTRDEIQKLLWHDATYVDFERGINHCVSQIRAVLEDHAETPRYIKTIPRRGYRFIAPVSVERPTSKMVPVASRGRTVRLFLGIATGFLAVLAVGFLVSKRASLARQRPAGVSLAEDRRTSFSQAINPQTFEAYLRGRYYWNKRTPSGLKKSIEYFQDAIERDPNFAQAYAGMADSYNLLAYAGSLPPKYAYLQATNAAMKAVRLDDTLADAHTSLADIHSVYDWNWPAAEKEYRRAIELNASYAIAHQWYASYLIATGRSDEGIEQARKALELDPLSLMINSNVGWSYYLVRRYDDALLQFQATLELDANFGPAHLNLGRVYEGKGKMEEAIFEMNKGISLSGESPGGLAALGHAYAVFGMRNKAREIIDHLMTLSEEGYVAPYDIAVVYAGLGNDELALSWLQKAYESRCGELMYIKVDPRLDRMRGDSRFRSLQHKMGL